MNFQDIFLRIHLFSKLVSINKVSVPKEQPVKLHPQNSQLSNTTPSLNKEQDFIYSFLSSVRQKVANPTGKKKRWRSN